MQLLTLIDLNMNPSPQGGFIVTQDRSFLKRRRSGKSGTSKIVSFEHAKASAALAASFKLPFEEVTPSRLELVVTNLSMNIEAQGTRPTAGQI